MEVYLNEITGIADGLVALSFSKRTWTRKLEEQVRNDIKMRFPECGWDPPCYGAFTERLMKSFEKFCGTHTTLLDMLTASVTVSGLHRGGQDDWDAHARRFDNRIIRASTRLGVFHEGEMSDWYRGKIIPMGEAVLMQGYNPPSEFMVDGVVFVRAVGGYIRKGLENNNDVMRGLYDMSIPSNFIFKVNLAQWCHVYRLRRMGSTANPEVQQVAEGVQTAIECELPWLTREFAMSVKI